VQPPHADCRGEQARTFSTTLAAGGLLKPATHTPIVHCYNG